MVSMEKNCDIKGSVKNEATLKGTIGQSIVYLGGGDVDLSDYYTKEEVNELFATKEEVGNIEEATAAIIALQNSYIGGETV